MAEDSGEKDEMIELNDRLVKIIVAFAKLENEKIKNEEKLKILRGRNDYKGNVSVIVNKRREAMEKMIKSTEESKTKNEDALRETSGNVTTSKNKYEEKQKEKQLLEQTIEKLKKEVDVKHLEKVNLQLTVEDLMTEQEFLKTGFDQEIKELESQVLSEERVIPGSTIRSLDLDGIVRSLEELYRKLAARAKEEAENCNKTKVDALVFITGQRSEQLQKMKEDISGMESEVETLKKVLKDLEGREEKLKEDLKNMPQHGSGDITDIQEKVAKQQEELKKLNVYLVKQVHEHQSLLNAKLILDIEIETYRELLEGQEARLAETVPSRTNPNTGVPPDDDSTSEDSSDEDDMPSAPATIGPTSQ